MRAMLLTGIRQMIGGDVADVRLANDTDVLLRVGAVGVCGSDVHYYMRGRIGSQVVTYPYRVGHEFAGTVVAVGPAVRRIQVGDRVAVDPAMSCGNCDQCLAGRAHTCRSLRFLGCPGQADGCLAEFIVMPEECCYPLREGTTLEQGALVEPLSIGIYAVRLAGAVRGAHVGILGCGPIGLCVLLPALAGGVGRIFATDRIDARLAVARKLGATWTGNPDRDDVARDVQAHAPGLLDVVFECCGQQAALDQAIDMLKPGGRLVIVGIPEVDQVSFSIDQLRRKEITIINVRRQNDCMQAALDMIEEGHVQVNDLVTHNFSLDRAGEAFNLVADYQDGVVKAMIRVGA